MDILGLNSKTVEVKISCVQIILYGASLIHITCLSTLTDKNPKIREAVNKNKD